MAQPAPRSSYMKDLHEFISRRIFSEIGTAKRLGDVLTEQASGVTKTLGVDDTKKMAAIPAEPTDPESESNKAP